MDEKNIMLLFQLIRTLQDSFNGLNQSFESKDAEKFESYKNSVLDIQNKIAVLIK
jgi:hypothetical protein